MPTASQLIAPVCSAGASRISSGKPLMEGVRHKRHTFVRASEPLLRLMQVVGTTTLLT